MALNRLSIIKLTELILVIVCVSLHYQSLEGSDNFHLFFTSSVFGGYLIIMIGLLLGFFVDTAFGRRTDIYFTLLGGVLYLIAGYMSYNYFSSRPKIFETSTSRYGMIKAWTAIATGIVFFVDVALGFAAQ